MTSCPAATSEWPARGEWRPLRKADGTRSALLSCPGCGQSASLSDHTIAEDGTVSPSVVCPMDCGFHDTVKLEGWHP